MKLLNKEELLVQGIDAVTRFCEANSIERPSIITYREGKPTFGVCAYYRDNVIHIWPRACAAIGVAGPAWSYPGYVVDRTPFGVLAHELGHHVEGARGARGGRVAYHWRRLTGDKPITGYCPNDNEWFAEIFRLYVTNPDLLLHIRQNVHALISAEWRPVELRTWRKVLAGSDRHINAAANKIREAQ